MSDELPKPTLEGLDCLCLARCDFSFLTCGTYIVDEQVVCVWDSIPLERGKTLFDMLGSFTDEAACRDRIQMTVKRGYYSQLLSPENVDALEDLTLMGSW